MDGRPSLLTSHHNHDEDLAMVVMSPNSGHDRPGAPFKQDRDFPPELQGAVGLADFLRYESDWFSTNRRRGELIDKDMDGSITDAESRELVGLEAYADYLLDRSFPSPSSTLKDVEPRLASDSAL